MNVDADGLNQLAVRLDRAPATVRAAARSHVRATAANVETTAKQLAPVKSGTLKRSIHTRSDLDGLAADVGTDLEYARRVELGFVGTDSLGRTYDQAPRAYLGPALDRHSPDFVTGLARIASSRLLG